MLTVNESAINGFVRMQGSLRSNIVVIGPQGLGNISEIYLVGGVVL